MLVAVAVTTSRILLAVVLEVLAAAVQDMMEILVLQRLVLQTQEVVEAEPLVQAVLL
jgi:hypothetical protein